MIDFDKLKNLRPVPNKLLTYGFTANNDSYTLTQPLLGGKWLWKITITLPDQIQCDVTDAATHEPLDLFYIKDAVGEFIGQINSASNAALDQIIAQCYEKCVFCHPQAQAVIDYVTQKYHTELEYLWEKFDDNAIWRRPDTKKWYGLLIVLNRQKLDGQTDARTEIIDLRAAPATIAQLIDHRTVFPAYHMNKQHWLTICLDGTMPTAKICKLLDQSYALAR